MPASKNSMIQTSKKLRTETFFHLSRRFQSGAKVWRELQQVPAINRTAAEHQMFQDPQQRLTPKQRLSYHKQYFFTFKCSCFLFLLNFIFQFHRLSFLYCPNFWRFPRPPAPPGSYAYGQQGPNIEKVSVHFTITIVNSALIFIP